MALLDIENLTVEFGSEAAPFRAVDNVTLAVDEGDVVGIVGESGSGKSVSSLAIMGLIDFPGRVRAERMFFAETDLAGLSAKARRTLVGKDIAMIFQDPMTSLNPCFTVGFQIMETLKVHEGGTRKSRRERAIELLKQVGIPDPVSRLEAFPHQLSGGMSQRVMIAIAIACNPRLLIADEPTTALDVTIQAQILELLRELQQQRNMAMMLITHDLGVVAENADVVCVMYAGRVVEYANVFELFSNPMHPYTRGLFASIPKMHGRRDRLVTITEVTENPKESEKLPGATEGVRPWWPWHNPPKDLKAKDEPAGDYYLQEVKPNHWVGVWRTEAVYSHESKAPDLSYRIADDPDRK